MPTTMSLGRMRLGRRGRIAGAMLAIGGAAVATAIASVRHREGGADVELAERIPAVDTSAQEPFIPELLNGRVLHTAALERAGTLVQSQIRRGVFPGAAMEVGRRGKVALASGIGTLTWEDPAPVRLAETRYDIASLTKVVATTTAVMLLVEDGRMSLDAPVRRYLPQFTGGGRQRVTVRQLLTHTSGLPSAGESLTRRQLLATKLVSKPGTVERYSDIGMIVLWEAATRAARQPLPALLKKRVWTPLGMTATGFTPGAGCAACAPTGRGDDWRGVVHDPIARRLGGVAGNAGLFSTARDLGRFAAMLASGGELDGVRVLKARTVKAFLTRQPKAGTRALGWDTRDGAVLHTGYTGTSMWIHPESGAWAVLLTNRTYQPRARGSMAQIGRVRSAVHTILTDATAEFARDSAWAVQLLEAQSSAYSE